MDYDKPRASDERQYVDEDGRQSTHTQRQWEQQEEETQNNKRMFIKGEEDWRDRVQREGLGQGGIMEHPRRPDFM